MVARRSALIPVGHIRPAETLGLARFGIRPLGPVVVKGKTELMSVFLCAHSAPDETVIGKAFDPMAAAPALLELVYADQTIQLALALGLDLVVDATAMRVHGHHGREILNADNPEGFGYT